MIVQQLLRKADYKHIGKIAAKEEYEYLYGDRQTDADNCATAYRAFGNKLQNVEPAESNRVMLGYTAYNSEGEEIKDVSLYDLDELKYLLPKLREAKHILSYIPENDLAELSLDDLKHLHDMFEGVIPQGYDYTFTDWAETLGTHVVPENVETTGIDIFVYRILYNCSFNGTTEEEQKKRKDEMDTVIEDLKKIEMLPKEEQEKHFRSADEVFNEFGLHDDRTQEEKDADMKTIYISVIKTKLNICRMLLSIADKIDIIRRNITMNETVTMKCVAPRGCGCDLWNNGATCAECAARKCENIRKIGRKAKTYGVESYINQVIADAFAMEQCEPEFRYTLMTINDIGYILVLHTSNKRAFRRIGYRLYSNFRKNFEKDIFVFNQAMSEVVLPEDKYHDAGYGVLLYSNSRGNTLFDANHTVAYIRDTLFGDITVSIFPRDGGPMDGALYPGYSNKPGEGRVLFSEIIKLRDDKMYRCKGRNAWNSYVKDYKQLCDGLTPDHAVHITVMSELTKKPETVTEEPVPETAPSNAQDTADENCTSCVVTYPEDEPAEPETECASCVVHYPEDASEDSAE